LNESSPSSEVTDADFYWGFFTPHKNHLLL
jgi:hypothetical protein